MDTPHNDPLADGYVSVDGQHDYPDDDIPDDYIFHGSRAGNFLSDCEPPKPYTDELLVGDLRALAAAADMSTKDDT